MTSKAFSGQSPKKPHLIHAGKGGVPGELWDTRKDVDAAFELLESRDTTLGYPELDWMDGGFAAAAGGDLILEGRNLIQGQEFAALTLGTGTSELIFTALKPGADGNDITIEIEDGGTAGSEVVAKTGNAFVITAEIGTSTADQIATAINADGADSDGFLRCNGGGSGTTVAVTAATNLTGGVGDGWACYISGVECLPANTTGANGAAALTEDECTVTVPALTGETPARAAGDPAAAYVVSNNIATQSLSGLLA